MKNLITKWPEIFWPLVLWAVALLGAVASSYAAAIPINPSTFGIIILNLLVFAICARIAGCPLPESFNGYAGGSSESNPKAEKLSKLVYVGLFGLAAFVFLYFYLRRGYLGVETADARQLRSNVDTSSMTGRLYEISSPLALACAFLGARWKLLRWDSVLLYSSIAVAFALSMVLSGARYEMLPLLLIGLATALVFHARIVASNLLKGIGIALVTLAFLGVGNVLLNMVAFRGGGGGVESLAIEERGIVLWRAVGVENVPNFLGILTGLFDEYLFRPIMYLDFYLYTNSQEPAYGGHQFSILAWRLHFRDGIAIKEEVDSYYSLIGIENNVWSTAIREMWIDFGGVGTTICFGVIGLITGAVKNLVRRLLIAQYAFCFFFAFMLFSPVSSAFRAISMQASFYFILGGVVIGYFMDARSRSLTGGVTITDGGAGNQRVRVQ